MNALGTMHATVWALCLLVMSVPTEGTAVTNWGKIFHTGLIKVADAFAHLIIVTQENTTTRVSVTGTLPGNTINLAMDVTRDDPAKITIPSAYLLTATTDVDWKKEEKGLKIESATHDIGVRLVTRSFVNKQSGAITVLPDTALGMDYRLCSGATVWPTGPDQFLIVSTEDGTTVTLDIMGPTIPLLQVNGVDVDSTGPGDYVLALDEGETFHILCALRKTHYCNRIRVTSTKNIAVIAGKENQFMRPADPPGDENHKGTTLMQEIPSKYAGTEFIWYGRTTLAHMGEFHFQPATPDVRVSPVTCLYLGTSTIGCHDRNNIRIFGPFELAAKSDQPIVGYTMFRGTGDMKPSGFNLPNIKQFSTRQSIYMEEGYLYHIIITGGDLDGISVTTSGITINFPGLTLCDDPLYTARTVVTIPADDTALFIYQTYTNHVDFVVTDTDSTTIERGLVEFIAAKLNRPFLVIVSEIDIARDNAVSTDVAFGINFVPTFDAGTCSVTPMVAGDEVDNDCDGRIDEELPNGQDDDEDGNIDEDLVYTSDPRIACLLDDVDDATRVPTTCSINTNEQVTYTCNTGFVRTSGDAVRTCQGGNTLSGTTTVCTPVCRKRQGVTKCHVDATIVHVPEPGDCSTVPDIGPYIFNRDVTSHEVYEGVLRVKLGEIFGFGIISLVDRSTSEPYLC